MKAIVGLVLVGLLLAAAASAQPVVLRTSPLDYPYYEGHHLRMDLHGRLVEGHAHNGGYYVHRYTPLGDQEVEIAAGWADELDSDLVSAALTPASVQPQQEMVLVGNSVRALSDGYDDYFVDRGCFAWVRIDDMAVMEDIATAPPGNGYTFASFGFNDAAMGPDGSVWAVGNTTESDQIWLVRVDTNRTTTVNVWQTQESHGTDVRQIVVNPATGHALVASANPPKIAEYDLGGALVQVRDTFPWNSINDLEWIALDNGQTALITIQYGEETNVLVMDESLATVSMTSLGDFRIKAHVRLPDGRHMFQGHIVGNYSLLTLAADGAVESTVPAPELQVFNQLAVGPNGTLYGHDNDTIYWFDPEMTTPQPRLALFPPMWDTVVAPGSSLVLGGTVIHPGDTPVSGQLWRTVQFPSGVEALLGVRTASLEPGQQWYQDAITLPIPLAAPEGEYELRYMAGVYPNTVVTADTLRFSVSAAD